MKKAEYITVTLTARVDGESLVLMTSDGVGCVSRPAFLCQVCTDETISQAEWWGWTAGKVRYNNWRDIQTRIEENNGPGWGRKVEAWIGSLSSRMKAERRRLSQPPARKYKRRRRHEPKAAKDWFEATRTMWGIIESERKRANESEWKRWAGSVDHNHRRKHGSPSA